MKKIYQTAQIKILELPISDMIRTSNEKGENFIEDDFGELTGTWKEGVLR